MTAYPTREMVDNLLAAAGWEMLEQLGGRFLFSPDGVMYALPSVKHVPPHIIAWENFINFQEHYGQK